MRRSSFTIAQEIISNLYSNAEYHLEYDEVHRDACLYHGDNFLVSFRSLTDVRTFATKTAKARGLQEIEGTDYCLKTMYFDYEVDGNAEWVQGELYYNKKKERFEHTHYREDESEVLIYWNHKF